MQKLPKLVQDDLWLEPYAQDIIDRMVRFQDELKYIKSAYGDLKKFASWDEYVGFNYDKKAKGWWYREWAPVAHGLFLIGDFNGWDRQKTPLERAINGTWEVFISEEEYPGFVHESKLKVHVVGNNGAHDRLPALINRVVQDEDSKDFSGQLWAPKKAFKWTDEGFSAKGVKEPLIYEAHTGMGTEKERVGTYREFADDVLPRIQALGYNVVQLMAVQEHPYYGSFGYHVSNFFAASSRFGTPEDLKYLVNRAHELGLAVVMDIVHSHAVKNLAEGLNNFDGSGHQYFHEGDRGDHSLWDSKVFDYGKKEVKQFLLTNIKYWLEEYHFDGFRFDGVTSMLYFNHGVMDFDHYDKYFKGGVDWDALTYFQLANTLIKEIDPHALIIAEDMSGMPGLCRPTKDGGLGFDYRLAMGVPDYWIKILKHKQDEEWNLDEIYGTLLNRRYGEKTIAYAESHDQALVGDKTLAFWLMDKEMYFHMQKDDDNIIIDRGIALHKIIRMLTISLGGEGYLTFMGNEFGHPEWIDFPREGNNWSFKHARRQWSLVDNEDLKFKYMNEWDKAMVTLIKKEHTLKEHDTHQLNMDTHNKVMIFKKGKLIFVFNISPTNSVADYKFFVPEAGEYKLVLNSDNAKFGGHDRIDERISYYTMEEDGVNKLSIYTPNRTVLVFKKK